jgi:prepilin-type N-terminal cleavage/methylation domain-containing protein
MNKIIFGNKKGMSLVEVLISVTILAVITLSVYSLIDYVLRLTAENKFKLGAIMQADLKMERVKNLPYDQVGTTAGIVRGVLPDNETINDNNGTYNINTLVQYKDDPFDGTASGTPNDLLPTDYKQVRILVRYTSPFGIRDIITYTNIAPQGIETSNGGGTLTINVMNSSGQPVSLANVHIVNNSLSPSIDITDQTDTSGSLNFPGAPPSVEGYQITVTKADYSTSSTTARTAYNPNPTLPNASVYANSRTVISFAIDLLGELNIQTVQAALPANWKINTDSGTDNQTNSRIAIDNAGNFYIVWRDFRSGSNGKVYGQKYNPSRVKQWASDVNIATPNDTDLPDVKVDSFGDLYVSWNDNSNGNEDVFLSKRSSANGNDMWTGPKKIDTTADNKDQTNSRIAVSANGTTTIVWQDNRNGNLDSFISRIDINHINIWASEVKLNTNAVNTTDQYEPVVAIDTDDKIYSAWTDRRNGNKDIYAARLNSSGTHEWANNLKLNTDAGTADQSEPSMAVDSENSIYATWTDLRNGNEDIYMVKFDAAGTLLWTPDNIEVAAATSSEQSESSITIDSNDNLYIVWTDMRNGNQDIFAQKYDKNGNRLWTDDLRVNINNDSSNQFNPNVTMNPANDKPVATWEDDRSGNADIYASQFDLYGSETSINNVPLIVYGAKQIGNNPVIFKYIRNHVTNASGLLNLPDMEWDNYTIATGTGYSAHPILMTVPDQPVNLPANSTLNVKIYME